MVYSLDPKITGKLTAAFADKENTVKEYRALLTGVPEDRCGELHDLLYHDAKRNKTYVVDRMRKGVREASLYYEVVSVMTAVRLFPCGCLPAERIRYARSSLQEVFRSAATAATAAVPEGLCFRR